MLLVKIYENFFIFCTITLSIIYLLKWLYNNKNKYNTKLKLLLNYIGYNKNFSINFIIFAFVFLIFGGDMIEFTTVIIILLVLIELLIIILKWYNKN